MSDISSSMEGITPESMLNGNFTLEAAIPDISEDLIPGITGTGGDIH
jgi:hypothetical protein